MHKNIFFKLGLLVSTCVHFSLIVFFPVWRYTPPPEPVVYEVALIKVEPKKLEVKKPKVKKAPAVPSEPKVEVKAVAKLSPVEIAVRPSQSIPVLTPHARVESKVKIPFPIVSFEPASPVKIEGITYKKEMEVKKPLQHLPAHYKPLPIKVPSPVQGEVPSFKPSTGEEEGKTVGTGIKEPIGITFKGLGSRKPERTPQPTYPPEMEQRGVEGEGEVKIHVAPTGQVLDVEITRSSGWPAFDKEIRSALLKWRFTPVDEPGIKTYEGDFYFRFVK